MYFIDGISNDPHFNLAFEENIFHSIQNNDSCFLLWQNDNAVIVGKNQNTIEEINQDFVRKHNISVVRRMSGGGAVYHDLGNINYTFITEQADMENFDFRFFTRPIILALQKLSVEVEFNSRNDLTIAGKKFSGNAQYIANNRILHHGTLLYDSNLDIMGDILNVRDEKISSKGIKSVRSRVTNISDHLEHKLSISEFKKMLKECIFEQNDIQEIRLSEKQTEEIRQLQTQKYDTWEWNYGCSPVYNLRKDRRFASGTLSTFLLVDNGKISEIKFYGDFFGRGDIGILEGFLIGQKIEIRNIAELLSHIDVGYFINGLTGPELSEMIVY